MRRTGICLVLMFGSAAVGCASSARPSVRTSTSPPRPSGRIETIDRPSKGISVRAADSGVSQASYQAEADLRPADAVSSPERIVAVEPLALPTFEPEACLLSLADVEQMAVERHPSLVAAGALVDEAAGQRHQVGLKPNPTVGYFGQQIADAGTDQHGIYLEQQFVRGGKLQLNRAVLSQTMSAQSAEVQTQRLRILTDVRLRYFSALAAQGRRDAAENFLPVAIRGLDTAEQRQRAGEGTAIETLQSQALLAEVRLIAEQSRAEYEAAWKDLAAVAGLTEMATCRLADPIIEPTTTPIWEDTASRIIATSPEMATARALVCEAQANLQRQQVQPIPNVLAQGGSGYDAGTDSGLINVQVGLPLPIHNRNDGNIAAARAKLVRATANLQRVELRIRSRMAVATGEYERSAAAVVRLQNEILPANRRSLELAEKAYIAGEVDFLDIVQLRRANYEAELRYITARGDFARASVMVDGMMLEGALQSPADYTNGDGLRDAALATE